MDDDKKRDQIEDEETANDPKPDDEDVKIFKGGSAQFAEKLPNHFKQIDLGAMGVAKQLGNMPSVKKLKENEKLMKQAFNTPAARDLGASLLKVTNSIKNIAESIPEETWQELFSIRDQAKEVLKALANKVSEATGEEFEEDIEVLDYIKSIDPELLTQWLDLPLEEANSLENLNSIISQITEIQEIENISDEYTKVITDTMLFIPAAANRKIKDLEINGEIANLDVGKKYGQSQQEVMIAISLESMAKDEGVEIKGTLEPIDLVVHKHILTLYWSGKKIFTIAELCAMIYGRDDDPRYRPSKKIMSEVSGSVERLRNTRVNIDYSKELEAHRLNASGVDGYIIGRNLISIDDVRIRRHGKWIEALRAFRVPPMLEYASVNNQLGTYPRALLDLPGGGKNRMEIVVIAMYMAERIEMMANKKAKGHRYQNKILLDTVISECNIEINTKNRQAKSNKKNRVIEYMEEALKINPKIKDYRRASQDSKDGYIVEMI